MFNQFWERLLEFSKCNFRIFVGSSFAHIQSHEPHHPPEKKKKTKTFPAGTWKKTPRCKGKSSEPSTSMYFGSCCWFSGVYLYPFKRPWCQAPLKKGKFVNNFQGSDPRTNITSYVTAWVKHGPWTGKRFLVVEMPGELSDLRNDFQWISQNQPHRMDRGTNGIFTYMNGFFLW